MLFKLHSIVVQWYLQEVVSEVEEEVAKEDKEEVENSIKKTNDRYLLSKFIQKFL